MRIRFLPFVFLATAAAVNPSASESCDCGSGPTPVTPGKYTISVLAVSLADDDGSKASYVTEEEFGVYLQAATDIYKRSGVDADFVLDPRSNFAVKVKSSLLNHDCLAKTTTPNAFTKQDVNGDGEVNSTDSNLICDRQVVSDARNAYALRYPSSIVVFIRYGEASALWDASKGYWTIRDVKAGWGYSGRDGNIIVLTPGKRGDPFLAHEAGHYLHVRHTHSSRPETLAAAESKVKSYIAAHEDDSGFDVARDGLKVFDGDPVDDVFDTPPDTGPTLFAAVNGTACDVNKNTVELKASLGGVDYRYTVKPDRTNVMSYFKNCTDSPIHFSNHQQQRIHTALQGHRQRLLHPELETCYANKGIANNSGSYVQQRERRAAIIEECLSTVPGAARQVSYVDMRVGDDTDEDEQECPQF